jgi:hypothetical protein
VRTPTILLVGGGAVVIGLVSGGVASGVFRGAGSPSAVADIYSPTSARATVARFAPEAGAADRQVVLQRTPDGYVCLWDTPDGTVDHGVGGCNPAADPLAGRKLFVSLAYDGGPAVTTVSDARLSGLVAQNVARIAVEMSDGSTRAVPLVDARATRVTRQAYRVFAYRIHRSDLAQRVGPVAVVALAGDGTELDRQTTGIGNG